ncbi:MAG: hypothetical protein WAZ27_00125, partial [Minisyncoccia bacterium]
MTKGVTCQSLEAEAAKAISSTGDKAMPGQPGSQSGAGAANEESLGQKLNDYWDKVFRDQGAQEMLEGQRISEALYPTSAENLQKLINQVDEGVASGAIKPTFVTTGRLGDYANLDNLVRSGQISPSQLYNYINEGSTPGMDRSFDVGSLGKYAPQSSIPGDTFYQGARNLIQPVGTFDNSAPGASSGFGSAIDGALNNAAETISTAVPAMWQSAKETAGAAWDKVLSAVTPSDTQNSELVPTGFPESPFSDIPAPSSEGIITSLDPSVSGVGDDSGLPSLIDPEQFAGATPEQIEASTKSFLSNVVNDVKAGKAVDLDTLNAARAVAESNDERGLWTRIADNFFPTSERAQTLSTIDAAIAARSSPTSPENLANLAKNATGPGSPGIINRANPEITANLKQGLLDSPSGPTSIPTLERAKENAQEDLNNAQKKYADSLNEYVNEAKNGSISGARPISEVNKEKEVAFATEEYRARVEKAELEGRAAELKEVTEARNAALKDKGLVERTTFEVRKVQNATDGGITEGTKVVAEKSFVDPQHELQRERLDAISKEVGVINDKFTATGKISAEELQTQKNLIAEGRKILPGFNQREQALRKIFNDVAPLTEKAQQASEAAFQEYSDYQSALKRLDVASKDFANFQTQQYAPYIARLDLARQESERSLDRLGQIEQEYQRRIENPTTQDVAFARQLEANRLRDETSAMRVQLAKLDATRARSTPGRGVSVDPYVEIPQADGMTRKALFRDYASEQLAWIENREKDANVLDRQAAWLRTETPAANAAAAAILKESPEAQFRANLIAEHIENITNPGFDESSTGWGQIRGAGRNTLDREAEILRLASDQPLTPEEASVFRQSQPFGMTEAELGRESAGRFIQERVDALFKLDPTDRVFGIDLVASIAHPFVAVPQALSGVISPTLAEQSIRLTETDTQTMLRNGGSLALATGEFVLASPIGARALAPLFRPIEQGASALLDPIVSRVRLASYSSELASSLPARATYVDDIARQIADVEARMPTATIGAGERDFFSSVASDARLASENYARAAAEAQSMSGYTSVFGKSADDLARSTESMQTAYGAALQAEERLNAVLADSAATARNSPGPSRLIGSASDAYESTINSKFASDIVDDLEFNPTTGVYESPRADSVSNAGSDAFARARSTADDIEVIPTRVSDSVAEAPAPVRNTANAVPPARAAQSEIIIGSTGNDVLDDVVPSVPSAVPSNAIAAPSRISQALGGINDTAQGLVRGIRQAVSPAIFSLGFLTNPVPITGLGSMDLLITSSPAQAGYCSGCSTKKELIELSKNIDDAFTGSGYNIRQKGNVLSDPQLFDAYLNAIYRSADQAGILNKTAFPNPEIFKSHMLATWINESSGRALSPNARLATSKVARGPFQINATAGTHTSLGVPGALSNGAEHLKAASFAAIENARIAQIKLGPTATSEELRELTATLYNVGQNSKRTTSNSYGVDVARNADAIVKLVRNTDAITPGAVAAINPKQLSKTNDGILPAEGAVNVQRYAEAVRMNSSKGDVPTTQVAQSEPLADAPATPIIKVSMSPIKMDIQTQPAIFEVAADLSFLPERITGRFVEGQIPADVIGESHAAVFKSTDVFSANANAAMDKLKQISAIPESIRGAIAATQPLSSGVRLLDTQGRVLGDALPITEKAPATESEANLVVPKVKEIITDGLRLPFVILDPANPVAEIVVWPQATLAVQKKLEAAGLPSLSPVYTRHYAFERHPNKDGSINFNARHKAAWQTILDNSVELTDGSGIRVFKDDEQLSKLMTTIKDAEGGSKKLHPNQNYLNKNNLQVQVLGAALRGEKDIGYILATTEYGHSTHGNGTDTDFAIGPTGLAKDYTWRSANVNNRIGGNALAAQYASFLMAQKMLNQTASNWAGFYPSASGHIGAGKSRNTAWDLFGGNEFKNTVLDPVSAMLGLGKSKPKNNLRAVEDYFEGKGNRITFDVFAKFRDSSIYARAKDGEVQYAFKSADKKTTELFALGPNVEALPPIVEMARSVPEAPFEMDMALLRPFQYFSRDTLVSVEVALPQLQTPLNVSPYTVAIKTTEPTISPPTIINKDAGFAFAKGDVVTHANFPDGNIPDATLNKLPNDSALILSAADSPADIHRILDYKDAAGNLKDFKVVFYSETNILETNDLVKAGTSLEQRVAQAWNRRQGLLAEGYAAERLPPVINLDSMDKASLADGIRFAKIAQNQGFEGVIPNNVGKETIEAIRASGVEIPTTIVEDVVNNPLAFAKAKSLADAGDNLILINNRTVTAGDQGTSLSLTEEKTSVLSGKGNIRSYYGTGDDLVVVDIPKTPAVVAVSESVPVPLTSATVERSGNPPLVIAEKVVLRVLERSYTVGEGIARGVESVSKAVQDGVRGVSERVRVAFDSSPNPVGEVDARAA